jgi:predicted Abi (CAAX) family protease
MNDNPFEQFKIGLTSWRVLFPRLASETIGKTLLKNGATARVITTSQLGDAADKPIAPLTL